MLLLLRRGHGGKIDCLSSEIFVVIIVEVEHPLPHPAFGALVVGEDRALRVLEFVVDRCFSLLLHHFEVLVIFLLGLLLLSRIAGVVAKQFIKSHDWLQTRAGLFFFAKHHNFFNRSHLFGSTLV